MKGAPTKAARSRRRPERVIGIGGIFLRTKDPDRLARWYRDHLGIAVDAQVVTFEWLSPTNGHRRGATLWATLADDDRPWGPGNPTAMVNYRVSDLDYVLQQLRKEGCNVEDRLDESEYGRFGFAIDPDGNRIELWEPPRGRYRSSDRHVPMK